MQILNILEPYPLGELGHNGAETLHLMAEAMKLAYADRSEHLGDPDFWPVPVAGLTAKAYAEALRATIDPERARPADEIKPGDPGPYESPQTTHFSVMDRWGNAVSNTYTLNFGYGSGIVAAGTGILLNNEMDDFSAKPGVPNAYGLIGGEANKIEPGKRPLSSMSPTLVAKDGKIVMTLGAAGGPRIISSVIQTIYRVLVTGLDIDRAVQFPRVHHQFLPNKLYMDEFKFSPEIVTGLQQRGHQTVEQRPSYLGRIKAVRLNDKNYLEATFDNRSEGAVGGY